MSEPRSNWPLRVLALALAIMAWVILSFTQRELRSEIEIEALVQYTNRPPALVVLNPVARVNVRLGGPASRMGSLNPLQVNVVVDLSDATTGIQQVALLPANVNKPGAIDVISIEPNSLSLELDELVTSMRRVIPQLVGEPAAGAFVKDPVVVSPTNVPLRGPKSVLEGIETISTGPVSLDGHAFEFEEQTVIEEPHPLVESLTKLVTVRVPLEVPGTNSGAGSGSTP